MAVNPKFVVFVSACVAIGATAIYFGRPHSDSTAKAVQISPASAAVPVQQKPLAVAGDQVSNTSGAEPSAIALAQTNNGAATTNTMGHFELMAWLRGLAATNLTAALDYISKMPEGNERDDATQAVCFGLAQKDPSRALDLAQSLGQPAAVSENIVQQWAGNNLPSALTWVHNQPDGDTKNDMLQRIVLVLSPSDPSDAAGIIFEQIPAGPAQDEAIMTLINQWGNKDLKGAAQWAQNLQDSPLRDRVLAELEGIQKYQHDLATK